MIRIIIGGIERQFSNIHDLDESWIAQQINRRQADRKDVCVRVFINEKPVNVLLTTPACSKGKGGGPEPKPQENAIFDIWDECGLNQAAFSGGNVIAFFKKLRKILD